MSRIAASRLPALFFDFGNVVAFFDYKRAWDALSKHVGLAASELEARVLAADLGPVVREHETGKIDGAAFWRELAFRVGLDERRYPEFRLAYGDIFQLNEPVLELIRGLREQGYPILVGSNTCDLHAERYRERFALELGSIQKFVLSYQVGVMKPSAAFFAACVQVAGAAASDCVFVDDAQVNVDAACAFGMHGILYRDTEGLVSDLSRLGIEAP